MKRKETQKRLTKIFEEDQSSAWTARAKRPEDEESDQHEDDFTINDLLPSGNQLQLQPNLHPFFAAPMIGRE